MGVTHLETFIKKHVENGYLNVSLIEECEKFERENNVRPILLIKLNGLLRSLLADQKEIICGIRHNILHEKFEDLVSKLSDVAELKFFCDYSTNSAKLPELIKEKNREFKDAHKNVADKINDQIPLHEIVDEKKEVEKFSTLSYVNFSVSLLQKYGLFVTAYDPQCSAVMTQFANLNSRVLAILDDDSDFLIYRGSYKYFSLRSMNAETLKTKEYNRIVLKQSLGLNDQELVLLSTFNGNNVISFREDAFYFHKYIVQKPYNPAQRLPAIAKFIKEHNFVNDENLASEIAYEIFHFKPDYLSKKNDYVKKVQTSLDFYDVDFENTEDTDETKIFCLENQLDFVYAVLSHEKLNIQMLFFDPQCPTDYFKSTNDLFSKHVGIILNYKSFEPYKIMSKHSFNNEYEMVDIIKSLPKKELSVPLIELLDRSSFSEHDHIRFELLKWLIGSEKLKSIDLLVIPEDSLMDILVLVYMVKERFIDIKTADIILLTIKNIKDGDIPENLEPPAVLHPRAFYATGLLQKCHVNIERCLEVTGLKEFKRTYMFDGVLFQNLYLDYCDKNFNASVLLGDLADYRYYA